jgi:hypothetical protein
MTARKPQQILPIIALSLVALTSCSKTETPQVVTGTPQPQATLSPSAQTTPAAKSESSDGAKACALLTSAEIEAVQGEPLKVTHPTGKTGGGLAISQCYFELPTPANSVVVTLTEKAEGAGSRDPKQSWEEMFHRSAEIEKRSEEKEERAAPNKIEGVGDEAFWTGSRIGGALYVLKGNSYIRISVGGAGDQAAKIEKSKTLAESILKRISQ